MSFVTVKLGDIAIEDRQIVQPDSLEALTRPYLGLEQIAAQTGHILNYETSSIEGKSTTFAFDESHVLYGKLRPYLNKVAVPERTGRCSTEIIPLLPRGVDRDFLALLLRTEQVVSAAMSEKTGSRMPRADMDVLLNYEVSIPESNELQRRIAAQLKAQLAAVEEARIAAKMQIDDVKKLIPAILRTAFGEVADAEMVCIGDVAPTCSGTTPSRSRKDYWEPQKYPWVKTGEVAFASIFSTEEQVSEKALRECSLPLLPPGTVLIAMYGQGKTRGQSAMLEVAATTNQACFAILPNETFEQEYLQFWLRHSYETLRTLSEGRGGNQANLNGGLLNAFRVPLIPRKQQKEIAGRIKAALAEATTLQAELSAQLNDLDLLPSRLLAQAFDSNKEPCHD